MTCLNCGTECVCIDLDRPFLECPNCGWNELCPDPGQEIVEWRKAHDGTNNQN
jgi:hypothetical protein